MNIDGNGPLMVKMVEVRALKRGNVLELFSGRYEITEVKGIVLDGRAGYEITTVADGPVFRWYADVVAWIVEETA